MFAALTLSGNNLIAAAIIFGVVLGFVLVKSGLIWRESVRDGLQLKNSSLLLTLLCALASGCIFFLIGRHYDLINFTAANYSITAVIIGGLLSGCGIALCKMYDLSAIAAFSCGRFYAIWVIIGMVLAVPLMQWTKDFVSEPINRLSGTTAPSEYQGTFFAVENPFLWILSGCILLILVLYIAVPSSKDSAQK